MTIIKIILICLCSVGIGFLLEFIHSTRKQKWYEEVLRDQEMEIERLNKVVEKTSNEMYERLFKVVNSHEGN